ncbi:Heterokaryon incompatibility protein (HET) domain containing protein [Naviculisporaceae sp. PSN 640]
MVRFDLPSPYEPVDSAKGQIRLLVLYPPDSSSKQARTIRCDLEYAYLSSKPQYEALSYTWGTAGEIPSEIKLGSQQFEVRENVAAALRRLRHPKKARVLWIDAICINQEDLAERAAQVLLMKQIYNQASQVCIWLGEPGDAGDVGMQMLQKKNLGAQLSKWKMNRPMLWAKKVVKSSTATAEKGDPDQEFTLGEVRELLSRPWWRRTWVIQEAVVASKIVLMCGEETAPWDSIDLFYQYLTKSRSSTSQLQVFGHPIHERYVSVDDGYQAISEYREKWQASPSNVHILDALYRFRGLDCLDPRDRIFAFLGIAPSAIDMGIVPDYKSSLTEVYTQFARKVIAATGSLDILNCKRESRGVEATPPPEHSYSLLDQSRYYDVDAEIIDGPDKKPRRGWARLPAGWERIPQGKVSVFFDHNTGMIHDKSPLEGQGPVPAEYSTEQRVLSPGWTRTWNNTGCVQVHYGPPQQSPAATEENAALQRERESQQAELSKLPSWVPNWATPTPWDPSPLLDSSKPATSRFSASGDTRCHLSPSPESNPTTLPLKGYILDTVSQAAAPWHPESNTIPPTSAKTTEPFPAWESLATAPILPLLDSHSSLDGPYTQMTHPDLTTSPRFEALLHTLIANHPASSASNLNQPTNDNHNNNSSSSINTDRTATASTDLKTLETLLLVKAFLTWSPSTSAPNLSLSGSQATTTKSSENTPPPLELELEFSQYFTGLSMPVVSSLIKTDEERTKFFDVSRVAKAYGEILSKVLKTCAHRRMFVTRDGYLGLGGWNAQPGDLVVILEGGGTPFLLRRRKVGEEGDGEGEGNGDEEEEEWDLVGETYVYGVMGGEALKPEMGLKKREFRIV